MSGAKGRSGRPPKPTHKHIEDGTYQQCRHGNRADVHYEPSVPVKPHGMEKHAAWLWDQVIDNTPTKFLNRIDGPRLDRLCDLWQRWMELRALIAAGADDKPTWDRYLKVGAQWDKVAAEFGIGLASRSRIDLKTQEDKESPTDILLKLVGKPN